jgi:hypothetical protein
MLFFAQGRLQPTLPWYTSLEQLAQLSYGFEMWAGSLTLMLPPVQPVSSAADPWEGDPLALGTSGMSMLAHALVYFSVMEMKLGQEEQSSWPFQAFGCAGGVWSSSGFDGAQIQNGVPTADNKLVLSEPIQIPRTQPLSAKLKLANEVRALIGTPAAPGVGSPLAEYEYETDKGTQELQPPPFGVRFTLYGRRIKKTQYGQLPPELQWIEPGGAG